MKFLIWENMIQRNVLVTLFKGPSINYVVSVGGGGSPQNDLLHRPYFIKKTTRPEERG